MDPQVFLPLKDSPVLKKLVLDAMLEDARGPMRSLLVWQLNIGWKSVFVES